MLLPKLCLLLGLNPSGGLFLTVMWGEGSVQPSLRDCMYRFYVVSSFDLLYSKKFRINVVGSNDYLTFRWDF